jgi:hypothetical protein
MRVGFQSQINDLKFEVLDIFQIDDGARALRVGGWSEATTDFLGPSRMGHPSHW